MSMIRRGPAYRRGRFRYAGHLVLALLLAATGCVAAPTTADVWDAPVRQAPSSQPPMNYVAEPPQPGASPRRIIQGFLDAMSAYEPNYSTARQYLSSDVRTRWRTDTVTVYSGTDGPLRKRADGQWELRAPLRGRLGADHSWSQAERGERLDTTIRLRKEGGEWRIAQPPDGVYLSSAYFEREYHQFNRYFFDPEFQILVPDPVYLPVRGNDVTLLVESLLAGPSRWLSPAVRTAIPAEVTLSVPSVVVDGKLASVDLDSMVNELTGNQRRLLAGQLIWTLGTVPGIERVRLTVERQPLRAPRLTGTTQRISDWDSYDPAVRGAASTPYAVNKGRVLMLSGEDDRVTVTAKGGLPRARSVAASVYGSDVAVVHADGRAVSVGRQGDEGESTSDDEADKGENEESGTPAVREVYSGGVDVAAPSWDRAGRLWIVDRRPEGSRIVVVDESGRRIRLEAPELAGKDVRGLRVARDGTRLAAIVVENGRTQLVAGRIRNEGALLVDGVRRIAPQLGSVSSIAWSDTTTVVVLGQSSAGVTQPWELSVDGSSREAVVDASVPRSIAAAPGQPLVVSDAQGELWQRSPEYRWVPRDAGIAPAYPG